jgi:hypothetical protein
VSIRAALDRLVSALARSARAFVASRAWEAFGYARVEDHARERFGRSGRWLRDLATLGEGLEASPRLAAALAGTDGERPIGRVAAVLVARAAGDGPVDDWVALARRVSVRDLRDAIRRAREAAPIDASGPHRRESEGPVSGGAGAPIAAGPPDDAGVAADPDDEERVLLRVPVPLPILAAFEETLDLCRSVDGRETPVTEFVEALLGEAQSVRPEGLERFVSPLVHGRGDRQVETALRRSTSAWESLPAPPEGEGALVAASLGLLRFQALDAVAGRGDAAEVDRQIRALVALEDELEAMLGEVLAEMSERKAWPWLRFAGVGHYAEERLGMSRSRAGERARLGRALRCLPRIAAACASGRLSMEAAGLIQRLLGDAPVPADLETAWIERAAGATIKRMRDEARAIGRYRARGLPARRPDASAPPGSPADWPLDDGPWQASLRREPGTARRRVFEFGLRSAGIDPDAAEPDVFQTLPPEPDVFLRLRLPADLAIDFLAAIEAARREIEQRAAAIPWDEPWPVGPAAPSEWMARISFLRSRSLPTWVGLLVLLEEFVALWDDDQAAPERRDDGVFIRDGWRCAAPGCTSRRHLEDHHVVYRSQGGGDESANRITLCRYHHQRGEHGCLLRVRGEAPLGLTWRLGRDDLAVIYRNERRVAPSTE